MGGRAVVVGCVLVLRRVAASDVAADLAETQVLPGITHLQTLLATLGVRPRIPDQLEMRTDLRNGHWRFSFPCQAVVASSSAASNCRRYSRAYSPPCGTRSAERPCSTTPP